MIALYSRDILPKRSRPKEAKARMKRLLGFFGGLRQSDINGGLCREYARKRGDGSAARRELEDLRAALNHHHREGLSTSTAQIVLPERNPGRKRWLTRSEAAALILAAWRHREKQKGNLIERYTRRHVARFILVGLYTGTRAGRICAAALQPTEGKGWIDLRGGVFYRRPDGQRQTNKRAPAIPLPRRLLAHLRRWKRQGQRYVVEWNNEPIGRMAKAFRAAVKSAGLSPDVTPHTLRHTAATWQMQAGVPVWPAAGYLGMSPETLLRDYGHHHPAYMREATDAFDRPRRLNEDKRKKPKTRKQKRQSTQARKRTI